MRKKRLLEVENLTIFDAFLQFQRYNNTKNLKPESLQYYEDGCGKLFSYLGKEFLVADVSEKHINQLKFELSQSVSQTSVNTYLRAIKAFLRWCMSLGYLQDFQISASSTRCATKETYTDSELKLLLTKPDIKKCTFADYRNWALTCFLIATGVRRKTLTYIQLKDIDLDNGYIVLTTTKNKQQQIIPISNALHTVIKEYLLYRQGSKDDYLFPTADGKQLSVDGLSMAVKYYNSSRGVTRTSIHAYRHTFAKQYIKNGGDVFRLQKLLGHSDISITQVYVNMFGEDLKDKFEEFNPLDNYFKQDVKTQRRKLK